MQNDFVETVDFCAFLVLMVFRYDFYHMLKIFALDFTYILCPVLLKPVKMACYGYTYLTNIINATQLWEF